MPPSEDASRLGSVFELEGLAVGFGPPGRVVRAVRGVSLRARDGETLGIVGESGSGKSVSLLAAFGLLPRGGRILEGRALFEGRDLGATPAAERRALLGRDIAFIFQNPSTSLNPVASIGAQIVEALRIHDPSLGRRAAMGRCVELLASVGIDHPERRAGQYPHEFSGGMCQRAMIAMALANGPRLLIADEPTTAVDVTTQAQILDLLRRLRTRVNGAVVLVSHDLGVIAENTDHVAVMYAGEVMERGATRSVLERPQHPYTQGLLSCRPSLDRPHRLVPIPGQPPRIAEEAQGCPFAPRCPLGKADPRCHEVKPPSVASNGSRAACHYAGETAFRLSEERISPARAVGGAPLLELSSIHMDFPLGRGVLSSRRWLKAVDDVDLALSPGEALGVVGESGSGKSTLARVAMRLTNATRGGVRFDGRDVTRLGRRDLRPFRDRVQMVFQDPFDSLAPHLTVGDNAAEPLRLRGRPPAERRRRVLARFAEVGLAEEHYDRPLQGLSGGQLQRVGIARALVVDPDLLVMDEPVSALDVSIQAQILNLLVDLKESRGLAYLFISHDMSVVRYLCDRIAVMRRGRIVEAGPTEEIFAQPRHDYTRSLLAAVPNATRTARTLEPLPAGG